MGRSSYQGFRLNSIWVIIGVNFLLFIATIISSGLISLFGLQPASILFRPWTIVTNLFVHAGFLHIAANMFTFYFFGSYLARLLGEKRLLLIYFGGGILGNIFFILLAIPGFLTSPFSIAVGASGAVFALGGVLTMMRPKLRVFVFPIPVPVPLWAAVIGGFLILSFLPYIAWQAHLGGLVFGLIAGYFFRRRERHFF